MLGMVLDSLPFFYIYLYVYRRSSLWKRVLATKYCDITLTLMMIIGMVHAHTRVWHAVSESETRTHEYIEYARSLSRAAHVMHMCMYTYMYIHTLIASNARVLSRMYIYIMIGYACFYLPFRIWVHARTNT